MFNKQGDPGSEIEGIQWKAGGPGGYAADPTEDWPVERGEGPSWRGLSAPPTQQPSGTIL